MGIIISKFLKFSGFPSFLNEDHRILLLGLDAAGKTTLLYKFKLNEIVTTIPTIGFNVETVQVNKLKMTIWDVGGQHKIRPLWRHYFEGSEAIVFVVDSSDRSRIEEASNELHHLLNEPALQGIPLLILANKQDLPSAMPVAELFSGLGLESISNRKWFIQSSCATSGDGIYEGVNWLDKAIKEMKK